MRELITACVSENMIRDACITWSIVYLAKIVNQTCRI